MSRRSGKTVEMILRAAENDGVIITHSKNHAQYIKALANEMGVKVPEVIVPEPLPKKPFTLAGVIVDSVAKPPWEYDITRIDERYEKTFTYEDVMDAITKLNAITTPVRYHFFTAAVANLVTDEECIEYFKDSGVIVVDRNGNGWLRGKPYEREI